MLVSNGRHFVLKSNLAIPWVIIVSACVMRLISKFWASDIKFDEVMGCSALVRKIWKYGKTAR